ncbi:MAG: phosphate signaling complex protein PhoU [Lentisphaerae bacterium]|nr:phosphate signaling complex protein PhoU [Lentisphaerota bacterium]
MTVHFINEIENLTLLLLEVTSKVEHAVQQAIQATFSHDVPLAQKIIDADDEIDATEILIEEECLKILALYQPVAGDLRKVITILKVNNEIERVGDLAVNIAERVFDMVSYGENMVEKLDFEEMTGKACGMLKKSLDSLTYRDTAIAAEVISLDDEVDKLHHDAYLFVREKMLQHPNQSGYYLDCLTISRCLERIADIATNISEDVIYMEQGIIVRHLHEGGTK